MADRIANKIPPIPHIKVGTVMNQASCVKTLYPIESEFSGVGYITDGEDFVIITSHNGYIRMNIRLAWRVLKEALECVEVIA